MHLIKVVNGDLLSILLVPNAIVHKKFFMTVSRSAIFIKLFFSLICYEDLFMRFIIYLFICEGYLFHLLMTILLIYLLLKSDNVIYGLFN